MRRAPWWHFRIDGPKRVIKLQVYANDRPTSQRQVEIDHEDVAWLVRLGWSWRCLARSSMARGRPTGLTVFEVCWGLRPLVRAGEVGYARTFAIAFEWPLHLIRMANYCPSRLWTGRNTEVIGVEHWTPRGWYRRIWGFAAPMSDAPWCGWLSKDSRR